MCAYVRKREIQKCDTLHEEPMSVLKYCSFLVYTGENRLAVHGGTSEQVPLNLEAGEAALQHVPHEIQT